MLTVSFDRTTPITSCVGEITLNNLLCIMFHNQISHLLMNVVYDCVVKYSYVSMVYRKYQRNHLLLQ